VPERGLILLTGYEPFGEFKRNSSIEACRKLEGMMYHGYKVAVEEITMDFTKVKAAIEGHLKNYEPSAVISTGVSGGGSGIAIERVAINVSTALPPRWDGDDEKDKPLREEGPSAYFTTLPYRKLVDAVKEAQIPANLSNSAGTVGCNQIFYHLMDYLARKNLDIPAGFIHIPRLPEQALGGRRASMDVKTSARAMEAVVEALAKSMI
jgi:pyroglutamyl-peptidase